MTYLLLLLTLIIFWFTHKHFKNTVNTYTHTTWTSLSSWINIIQGEKYTTKVKYPGYLFSAKGMEPADYQKVSFVCDWDTAKNVGELRSFLGFASSYWWYIYQFADIGVVGAPLNNLTKKTVFFVWNNNCQSAFETLKRHLTQAVVLVYPDFSANAGPFQLHTDAGATGLAINASYCAKHNQLAIFV